MSEVLGIITSQFEGENPFGENINYDPSFDALKSEMGKMGNIDYAMVEETARSILSEKSKDIRAISFLSFVYLRGEDWEQFSDTFEGLTVLVEGSYERLFPERPRAKELALKWLSEPRYSDTLAERKPQEQDYDHVKRLVGCLEKLKSILEPLYPEGSPFPSNIYRVAQAWEKACKPKPKPEPSAAGAQAGQADTPKQAQANARKAALFLIEQEPLKPMGYRFLRSSRWDLLEKAPPVAEGKTQLVGPNEQQRAYFQGLLANKDWKTAIEKGEVAFTAGANHLWLDLQRIAATACKELGEDYGAVRGAILFETAMLLKRVPELTGLVFSDGSAFCDDATKTWIGTDVNPMLSSGPAAVSPAVGTGGEDPVAEEKMKIDELAGAGQVEQALEMLQGAMSRSTNERDNFRRSILMGSLLLKGKQPDIAVSILEALDDKIEAYKLDRWDPDLTMDALAVLHGAYKAAKVQKPQNVQIMLSDKQNTILSRISRINPKKAFLLNK